MKPILTVFTPTYNRAHTLHLCYESLKRQTCKDFLWLIIDDGSTDETEELVKQWINEGAVSILYYYQENQGMHGAHNSAYKLIETELNICIDSDDYMSDHAVEIIVAFWRRHGGEEYAGIVGLDATFTGQVIGTAMPEGLHTSTLTDLYNKHKVKGDKKLVYRTDLTKACPPYPLFPGEKYCPLVYKYILIDQFYPLLVLNKILCHVEYLPDGSSMNMFNQYRKNPRGFLFFRKVAMKYTPTLRRRFRESIHFVSTSIMIKNYRFISESPCKLITLFSIPFGLLLYLFIRYSKRTAPLKYT